VFYYTIIVYPNGRDEGFEAIEDVFQVEIRCYTNAKEGPKVTHLAIRRPRDLQYPQESGKGTNESSHYSIGR
jgi:hypothetical protein